MPFIIKNAEMIQILIYPKAMASRGHVLYLQK